MTREPNDPGGDADQHNDTPDDTNKAFRRLLEAEDAERERPPKSVMQTFDEVFKRHEQ